MNRLKKLIKKEIKVILFTIFNLIVFYLIFKFTNLSLSYYKLGFQIIIFILVLYLIANLILYKKEEDIKEENQKLKHENQKLVNEKTELKNDILEYFFLWIHQIKTPITSAKLLLQRENIDKNLLDQQLFYIEDYTNMALTYLKITNLSSDLDISPVNLDTVIRQTLRKYSILFISNKVKLNYEPIDKTVITDAKYLSLVIEQILSNATKYAKNKSVTIGYDQEENSLIIKDTGIGILEEDLPKIFDRGYCGFNGRMNQKSSGIGLFLVKEISKKLNIQIQVKSKINQGTTFYLKFNN